MSESSHGPYFDIVFLQGGGWLALACATQPPSGLLLDLVQQDLRMIKSPLLDPFHAVALDGRFIVILHGVQSSLHT